jgi:membrane-associated protease RseP (regulator of RpoE activity)
MANIKVDDLGPTNIVEGVSAGSVAEKIGLQRGDRITGINGQAIAPEEIPEKILASKGTPISLTIDRQGSAQQLGPVAPQLDQGVHRLGFTLIGAGAMTEAQLDQVAGGISISQFQPAVQDPLRAPDLGLPSRLRMPGGGLIGPVAGVRG